MTRFETATHPGVYWAIALSVAAVFILDLNTPMGVATWMLYVVPIVLCFFVWRRWVPILVAGTSTLLLVIDYFVSAPGIATDIALGNRAMGLIVIWVTAVQARHIIRSRLALRQQDWIRAARARLADCLAGEQSAARLTSRVLHFVADYLNAQAGAIYVAESGGRFTRTAGIAIPPGASQTAAVSAGEGLLGRAIADRRAIELTELPEDYLKITSALGERKPHALLIAPLIADSEVHGLVELGFLHRTHESDLELLRTLAEPIAIGIRTTMLRAEREHLLQETQSQAEELQARQEQLRVANEELLSQSNILREKVAELARANQYKTEFLANMSRELRTPLNSVLILSKLLADNREENLTPEQVGFARGIYSAGNDLLELLRDAADPGLHDGDREVIRRER